MFVLDKRKLGEHVRVHLAMNKISRTKFADDLSRSKPWVARIYDGEFGDISITALMQICSYIDKHPAEFVHVVRKGEELSGQYTDIGDHFAAAIK